MLENRTESMQEQTWWKLQVVCWHFVRLCGAAGFGGEVSDEKNNPNTPIFELHFPPPEFEKKTNKF